LPKKRELQLSFIDWVANRSNKIPGKTPVGGYAADNKKPEGSEYRFIKLEDAKLRRCYIGPLDRAWHKVGDSDE